MPNNSPSITMNLEDIASYKPQEAQVIDISKWKFNFTRGHEHGVAGKSYIDLGEKEVTSTIPHGLYIDTEDIENAVNVVNFTMVVQGNENNFTVDTSYIFNCLFNVNERVTCANYAISDQFAEMYAKENANIASDGHAIGEPRNLKFEWPNKTNVNICTEMSEFSPVGCNYDGKQYACEMYKPDIRDISLITSEDNSLHINVRHLRVGLGDLLVQVLVGPQDEAVKAFIFAPPALEASHLGYLDDIEHVMGDQHYSEDFYQESQAFVNDLIEEAVKSECGEITTTDLNATVPDMEYFQYVTIR